MKKDFEFRILDFGFYGFRIALCKAIFTFCILHFTFYISSAQDIHFSQFYNSPLVINPANTGKFDGDYRLTSIYRSQWKSVSVPYKTFTGSFDMNINLDEDATKYYSAGIMLYQDKAGDSEFGTLHAALSFAYNFFADNEKKHLVTLALQPAFAQRSINYSKLTFDSQYNGDIFDANLPTNETFNNTKFIFFDLNAGVSYTYGKPDDFAIGGGIGVEHINQPKQTLFNDNNVKLFPRFSFDVNSSVKLTDRFFLLPAILFQNQNKFNELNGGANLKIVLTKDNPKKIALYLGGFYRVSDALIPRVGLDYNYLHVGFSYDVNISDLKRASNNRGGPEISLVYIIKTVKPLKIHPPCPVY